MHIRRIAHPISLLGQTLREPGLPVAHILLISRPEVHVGEAIYESLVSLVYEVPVKNSGKGAVFLSLRHLASICIITRSISTRHGGHMTAFVLFAMHGNEVNQLPTL